MRRWPKRDSGAKLVASLVVSLFAMLYAAGVQRGGMLPASFPIMSASKGEKSS